MKKFEEKIDIHGLTEDEAYCALLEKLNNLKSGTKKLVVVHGYHGGNILKNMVANFQHYKIESKVQPFYNDGETIFYIKD